MTNNARIIRIGVLYQGTYLRSWESQALRSISLLANTSLEVLIEVDAKNAKAAQEGSLLWQRYLKWFYRPSALLQTTTASDFALNVPRLTCTPQLQAAKVQLDETTVAAISSYQLDFILSFADQSISSLVANLTQVGVWYFQFGAQSNKPNLPIGFWETHTHKMVTPATLYQLAGTGETTVLKQGYFRTLPHSLSLSAATLYKECSNWPADMCRQLLAGCKLPSSALQSLPAVSEVQVPSNTATLRFLGQLVKQKVQQLYNVYLQADQWNMGVVDRPIQDFLRPETLRGVKVDAPVLPSRNVFYADCFARQEASGAVIYFEAYDYRVRRGNISRLNYPWEQGSVPELVLDFPFHLSYPFLFGPYCIPEAWVTNGIRMYDLRKPVTDHTTGQLLLEAPAVDSTLLEYDGRYWLFYTRMDRDPMLNLYISYADRIEGPWHEHPQNPVKTDIRSARPAGPFFEEGGKLYRPAQDCAKDYGYGITINEVLTLTTTEYVEREASVLTSPHPDYPDGLHTIVAVDATRTIIDFKRRRFIPFATLLAVWIWISGFIKFKKKPHTPQIAQSSQAVPEVKAVSSVR
ncbi:glucosamine inositolphosphorylceramide transferase family protein [Hymenobacter volaticus]|uniref:Glucosamine inositolphosphorylceramide transferase 1 N-terminal domain-containing protein n=1 Tax=Hymenobacter volaticus TaxID=2932254 RepID=A0ABY4G6K8_9BACT|nr:hypothetical protein [Hymenobacter volaticus]UOQ66416.1 hypothetical protein MUN86_00325 [Hymenobacter volaticus]